MAIELEDGTIVRSLPEQVSKNLEDLINLSNQLAVLKQQVEAGLAAALHYKGSVATYGDLPSSGNEVGDVWNVLSDGKNYAWTGSAWDELGGTIDLSNYAQKSGTANSFSNDNTFGGDVNFYGSEKTVLIGDQTNIRSNNGYEFAEQDSHTATLSHSGSYQEFTFYDIGSGHSLFIDFQNSWIYGNDPMDLGTSTYMFDNLYLNTAIYLGAHAKIDVSGNNITLDAYGSGGYVYSKSTILPSYDNQRDLGSSSYQWKDIYASGSLRISGNTYTGRIYNSGNRLRFEYGSADRLIIGNQETVSAVLIRPSSNNTYDLGTATVAWKDLYLSGSISDGTNSATATEIAALVAYAKAQGWIS